MELACTKTWHALKHPSSDHTINTMHVAWSWHALKHPSSDHIRILSWDCAHDRAAAPRLLTTSLQTALKPTAMLAAALLAFSVIRRAFTRAMYSGLVTGRLLFLKSCKSRRRNCLRNQDQNFSIGLRSGLCAGIFQREMSCRAYAVIDFVECKNPSPSHKIRHGRSFTVGLSLRSKRPKVPSFTAPTHSSIVHFFHSWNTMGPHPPLDIPPQSALPGLS